MSSNPWDHLPVVPFGGVPGSVPPAPCVHRGEPLAASVCVALGLSPLRSWAPCGHPHQPRGIYVCPCKGCNASCVGYTSEKIEENHHAD